MHILVLGNSLTFANDMPQMPADLSGAAVVHHTRGGARLSERLNPKTSLCSRRCASKRARLAPCGGDTGAGGKETMERDAR